MITNGETLDKLFGLNYLVELPADKRPNFDKYASDAVKSPPYDDGNKFTMAWQSGLTGIGWDPVQVKELRPDNPTITSMNDLFDPAFMGKVGMFGDNARPSQPGDVGPRHLARGLDARRLAEDRGQAHAAARRRHRAPVLRAELHPGAGERRRRRHLRVVRRHLPDQPDGRPERPAVLRAEGRRHHLDRQHVHPHRRREPGGRHHDDGLRLQARDPGHRSRTTTTTSVRCPLPRPSSRTS